MSTISILHCNRVVRNLSQNFENGSQDPCHKLGVEPPVSVADQQALWGHFNRPYHDASSAFRSISNRCLSLTDHGPEKASTTRLDTYKFTTPPKCPTLKTRWT
jgi:hypothetical protein